LPNTERMHTTEDTMSDSEPSAKPVEQRLAALEERVSDLEAENQQLRTELAEERENRQALVDTLGDVNPEAVAFGDVALGGAPIETLFSNRGDRIDAVAEYIFGTDGPTSRHEITDHIDQHGSLTDQLADGEVRVEHGGLTETVRQRLLPIHEMWIDLRDGREEKLPGDRQRRGARLFARFIRKASGEHDTGVNADYGTYSMGSKEAKEILAQAGDMTNTGKTMTVKRAMQAVQTNSKRRDCECTSLAACEHGVFSWDSDGGHTLTANKDRLNAILGEVEAAINGEIDDADDQGNACEDADATGEFDALDAAEAVTNDDTDPVTREETNDVVSTQDGPVLEQQSSATHDP
jgi:hypothetical protein